MNTGRSISIPSDGSSFGKGETMQKNIEANGDQSMEANKLDIPASNDEIVVSVYSSEDGFEFDHIEDEDPKSHKGRTR
jgi:hypothetical protein